VIAEKRRYRFQRDKQKVSVSGVKHVLLELGDLFFLALKAFAIFGDVTFDCSGKVGGFFKFDHLFYEQAKQSMPLGPVGGGVKLLQVQQCFAQRQSQASPDMALPREYPRAEASDCSEDLLDPAFGIMLRSTSGAGFP
jgi:hypothetical protein